MTDPREPLLRGVSQFDVDFVIPRVGIDLPLGIDPFLLYKSRNPEYRSLHSQLLVAFNAGIAAIRRGDIASAKRLFAFPEVAEIGLGHTATGRKGSGVGSHLAGLIIDTLTHSPGLQERGVKHVEEMQLVSAGIGPDRVSDITANILKEFLVEYTQKQCSIWSIPLESGAPIEHIYDPDLHEWTDGYFDLPVSPADGLPILFVPRRIVRSLPWINYDDFVRTEFRAYLEAKRVQRGQAGPREASKPEVASITRKDIVVVERYVRQKEIAAADARPTLEYIDTDACEQADKLKHRLSAIPSGAEAASAYQQLVLEVLNFLFNPELIDGEPEVRTVEGTERRDIIFSNDSDESFWDYIRSEHSGLLVMFEVKNKETLDLAAVNQTATYLGDRIGSFGVIVTRNFAPDTIQRKLFAVYNDSAPKRKVILVLSDADLRELLDLRCRNGDPTKWVQRHYRKFRTAVQ